LNMKTIFKEMENGLVNVLETSGNIVYGTTSAFYTLTALSSIALLKIYVKDFLLKPIT